LEGGECGPERTGEWVASSGRANWGQSKFFNFYASPGSKTQAVSKKLKR